MEHAFFGDLVKKLLEKRGEGEVKLAGEATGESKASLELVGCGGT